MHFTRNPLFSLFHPLKMAPFICRIINSAGLPLYNIPVVFKHTKYKGLIYHYEARTDKEGCVTSWYACGRTGNCLRYTFDDNAALHGMLEVSHTLCPLLGLRQYQVHIELHLEGRKNHCILLRLLDQYSYEVQQSSFLPTRPAAQTTPRNGQWTLEEDMILRALRNDGWTVRNIWDGKLLPGRSLDALTSRSGLLRSQLFRDLRSHAVWQ